jgi:hypothetical protein
MMTPPDDARSARVAADYHATYPDPIQIRAGDLITTGKQDDEWPEYVWCTARDGRSGWVPQRFFERRTAQEAVAVRDYSAAELDVRAGEQVALVEEAGGWWWVTNTDGCAGWVPAGHLAITDQ